MTVFGYVAILSQRRIPVVVQFLVLQRDLPHSADVGATLVVALLHAARVGAMEAIRVGALFVSLVGAHTGRALT